jgi:hypothetical protein
LAVLVTGLALARLACTAPLPEVSQPEVAPSGVAHRQVPRPEVSRAEPACV